MTTEHTAMHREVENGQNESGVRCTKQTGRATNPPKR